MNDNLKINDLSIGISVEGMKDYKEKIRTEILKETKNKINQVEKVEKAINEGWQGVSRDRFLERFKTLREKIGQDLEFEYGEVEARMNDLNAYYFRQDDNLIEKDE